MENPITEKYSAELSLKTNRHGSFIIDRLRLYNYDFNGKNILDLGSGPDHSLADYLSEKYKDSKVFSLDYNLATQTNNKLGVNAYFSSIPFQDDSFDLIIAHCSIPLYIHNREEMLKVFKGIKRVLKVGGEIRITPITYTTILDPSKEDMDERYEKRSNKETYEMICDVIKEIGGFEIKPLDGLDYRQCGKNLPAMLIITKE